MKGNIFDNNFSNFFKIFKQFLQFLNNFPQKYRETIDIQPKLSTKTYTNIFIHNLKSPQKYTQK